MEDEIKFYYEEKGDYAPREGISFVRRNNIAAIIKYKDKFMFLSWNEVNYNNSLVTGGIDEGESVEEAVKREVIEETGYYDFKNIIKINAVNVSKFFVEHKNQNREAVYYPYLVELDSLSRREVTNCEKQEHTCIWVNKENLDEVNLFVNHKMMLDSALQEL